MRKIAILKCRGVYDAYDNSQVLIEKITDFTEVDEPTFEMLLNARNKYGFEIVEQVIDQESFIENTVAGWTKHVAEEGKRRAAELANSLRLKKEREAKRDAKREETKRKTLEKLLKEFGTPQTTV
jgi:hypothetical protein